MLYFYASNKWTGDAPLKRGFFYGVSQDNLEEATKHLQRCLNIILGASTLIVDGDYGPATTRAVQAFQKLCNLTVTGVVDHYNWSKLIEESNRRAKLITSYKAQCLNLGQHNFVVFVDAGHGGLDKELNYTTSGKRAYHQNEAMHHQGHYYEGHENRIAAEAFIRACTQKGILCIRTYHPVEDWPLSKRTAIIRDWLERGYYGYLHSFHSNAISSRNTAAKLEATRGFMVFTTKGDSLSDELAQRHFKHVEQATLWDWKYRSDETDGDKDYEANFQVLRETDLRQYSPYFAAILEEWGFHTSKTDAQFITSTQGRAQRVKAALNTAIWAKANLFQHIINY